MHDSMFDEFDEFGEFPNDLATPIDAMIGWKDDEIIDFFLTAPHAQIKRAIIDFKKNGRESIANKLKKIL